MQLPLQVSFQNMKHSGEVENAVRDKATKLDQFADHIMSCRVVVEMPHRHHLTGNQYNVRVSVTVPGEEIVATRDAAEHTESRDIQVALRAAFDSARRQLEDYVARRRKLVKTLETNPHGRVSRLFPQDNYGFIETVDGREIFFHGHSVLHKGFTKLKQGTEVSFVEEEGHKGPQASTVKIVGRHGHA